VLTLLCQVINPLNAELNPICHLLDLFGAHHILHVSRVQVKEKNRISNFKIIFPYNVKLIIKNYEPIFTVAVVLTLSSYSYSLFECKIIIFCQYRSRKREVCCHIQHSICVSRWRDDDRNRNYIHVGL